MLPEIVAQLQNPSPSEGITDISEPITVIFLTHLDPWLNLLVVWSLHTEYLGLLGLELLVGEDPLVLERTKALELGEGIFM